MNYRKSLLVWLLASIGLVAYAQDSELVAVEQENVQLLLESLHALQTGESVDELYLSIAVYPAQDTPYHFRVPSFPSYWPSTHIQQVQDVVLWTNTLAEQKSFMLVITLLEHDSPPWNNDDLIGIAKLKVRKINDVTYYQWLSPGTEIASTHQLSSGSLPGEHTKVFDLQGEHGHYQMALKLTIQPAAEEHAVLPSDVDKHLNPVHGIR